MAAVADLAATAEMVRVTSGMQVGGFCAPMIFLSICLMLFFAYSTMFSFSFKSFETLVIIWRICPNFSSCACKNFYSCKMVSIRSNMALIIACRGVFSLSRIIYIIWICLAKKKLLNYSPLVQTCSGDLTTCAIEVRLCSLRYKNCNGSRSSIRFTAWRHKSSFLLSVTFATNSGIAAVMA